MNDAMTSTEMHAIRLALGLTQSELADAMGVTRTYIGLLERGTKPIGKRMAEAIRRATPKPLNTLPTEPDPIARQIETALIHTGIPFEKEFKSEGEVFDFFLPHFGLAIIVQRDNITSIRKTSDVRDIIVANGRFAAEAIATMIGGRSLRLLKPERLPIEL